MIQSIAKYTLQIEKVVLAWTDYEPNFVENVKQLKRLTALKSLQIDCGEESFSSVLRELATAHIPLEYLKLSYFYSDEESVNELEEFKQLKVLDLYNVKGLEIDDILFIVSNLIELTELAQGEIRKDSVNTEYQWFGWNRAMRAKTAETQAFFAGCQIVRRGLVHGTSRRGDRAWREVSFTSWYAPHRSSKCAHRNDGCKQRHLPIAFDVLNSSALFISREQSIK